VQTDADFLVKDFENLLVGTALEHVAMRRQDLDRLLACLGRFEIQVGPFGGRKISKTLVGEYDVLDLVHEDVDAGVEPLGNRVVEGRFKLLLLPDDRVEEVLFVDVGGLVDEAER
jgi:hypothetical protein